jgi:hypothetical protein
MSKKYTRKNRRYRRKRGGDPDDIESGLEPMQTYMGPVPPDPKRFEDYEKKMSEFNKKKVQESFDTPISPDETAAFFEKPNPTEVERMKMTDEDPHYKDPWEELTIFSNKGGRRRTTKKRRRNKRKSSRHRRH